MRLGILGGTFDPIHRGHVSAARSVLERFELDRVLFMVAYYPSHKRQTKITSPFHRYAMTVLELIDDSGLYACKWELERREVSYTIKTLNHFETHHPEHRYCFIAGTDSLKEIHLWKDYVTLLRKHCFIFVQRPGTEIKVEELKIAACLKEKIREVCQEDRPVIESGRSFIVSLNTPPISSTEIRTSIGSGRWPSTDTLSAGVLHYIKKHGLYERNQSDFKESL